MTKLTDRQTEIIHTALALTARRGIHALTIKNLAASLNISEPAIYRHFHSKAEIIRAMIGLFDDRTCYQSYANKHGFEAVAAFIRSRIEQVTDEPPLARVLFAEELFLDEPECSAMLNEMMKKHKRLLQKYFHEAQDAGEIRGDLNGDTLFRLVFGPVRLLVKQWGMSGQTFDLRREGELLIRSLRKILN